MCVSTHSLTIEVREFRTAEDSAGKKRLVGTSKSCRQIVYGAIGTGSLAYCPEMVSGGGQLNLYRYSVQGSRWYSTIPNLAHTGT